MPLGQVLVVDDEPAILSTLKKALTLEGYSVDVAGGIGVAEERLAKKAYDVLLLDVALPDGDGLDLLARLKASAGDPAVIMMSGHGTIDTAVEATKFGAMAFLEKPITLQKLLRAVEQGLAKPPSRAAAALNAAAGDNGTLTVEAAMTGGTMQPLAPVLLGPQPEQSFDLDRPLREARDAFEKSYFEFHLAQENGSMTRVAEKTGLERTHLYRKLKQLGVDLSRNKRSAI
jgi:DNA-binding NtrC family response regulator